MLYVISALHTVHVFRQLLCIFTLLTLIHYRNHLSVRSCEICGIGRFRSKTNIVQICDAAITRVWRVVAFYFCSSV